eukprot:TRINITY_DN27359_c0_g1_i1.p1 TRINITY_DN27359_c0_g1~~TRINITY_DN27359_c0_g1_i1.p1  ORF type:complete len:326 (+),score=65.79 TRINITY_DN27359_c0_g1_i1:57-1034(+)
MTDGNTPSWEWKKWESTNSELIPEVESASVVCVEGVVVVVGGYQECDDDDDDEEGLITYEYNNDKKMWSKKVFADVPHVEGCVAVLRDAGTALLHGGIDQDYEMRSDVYEVKANPLRITKVADSGEPPARGRHAGCCVDTTLYVFGGMHDASVHGDLNKMSVDGAWEAVQCDVTPPARYSSTMAHWDSSLVLFGGAYLDGADQRSLADLWVHDIPSAMWRPINISCSPRNGHVATLLPNTSTLLILSGAAGAASGGGSTGSYDDMPLLIDLSSGSVSSQTTTGTHPIGRYLPAAALSPWGSYLIQGGTKRLPGSGDIYELIFKSS